MKKCILKNLRMDFTFSVVAVDNEMNFIFMKFLKDPCLFPTARAMSVSCEHLVIQSSPACCHSISITLSILAFVSFSGICDQLNDLFWS